MKKMLNLLMAVSVAAGGNVPAMLRYEDIPEEAFQKCDFNNDGKLDNLDTMILMNRYAETATANKSDYFWYGQAEREAVDKYGDLNQDGRINGIDATLFAKYCGEHGIELVQLPDYYFLPYDESMENSDKFSLANAFAMKTPETFMQCDFNRDGIVNGADLRSLIICYTEEKSGEDMNLLDGQEREVVVKSGDIYSDGKLSLEDVILLYNYIFYSNKMGDVNCDGTIDAKDATIVLSYYSKDATGNIGNGEIYSGDDYGAYILGDFDENKVVDGRDASALLLRYARSSAGKR